MPVGRRPTRAEDRDPRGPGTGLAGREGRAGRGGGRPGVGGEKKSL